MRSTRLSSISSEMSTNTICLDEARPTTGGVAGNEKDKGEEAARGTEELGREERGGGGNGR